MSVGVRVLYISIWGSGEFASSLNSWQRDNFTRVCGSLFGYGHL